MKKEILKLILRIVVIGIIAAVIGYLAGSYVKYRDQLDIANETINDFTVTITQQGAKIATQEQHIVTLEQAKKQIEYDLSQLKDKGIKDASTIIWLRSEIKRLQLVASYTDTIIDTIIVRENADLKIYRRVPAPFSYTDQWATVSGVVQAANVDLTSIITYSEPSIILGWETGYFKKTKPIIVYEDQNPYNQVISMDNMIIQQKPRFYKTPMWHRLEGAVVLFGIAKGIQAINK